MKVIASLFIRLETLLQTHPQKKITSDTGYDQQKRIVYVPTSKGRSDVAYNLK